VPRDTAIPVPLTSTSTSTRDQYAPGIFQVLYRNDANSGGNMQASCTGAQLMHTALSLDFLILGNKFHMQSIHVCNGTFEHQ
jgi:hypothetical protein